MDENGADIYSKYEVKVQIYILKGLVNSEHYWVYDSSLPDHVTQVFSRVSAQVTIQPGIYSSSGPCNDLNICYTVDSSGELTSKPIIMWKNPYLKLYVTRRLTLKNIIFDGADIVTQLYAYDMSEPVVYHIDAISQKSRYCIDETTSTDDISVVPNPSFPEGNDDLFLYVRTNL